MNQRRVQSLNYYFGPCEIMKFSVKKQNKKKTCYLLHCFHIYLHKNKVSLSNKAMLWFIPFSNLLMLDLISLYMYV